MSDPQATGTGNNDAGEPQDTNLPSGSEGNPSPEAKPTEAPAPGAEAEVVYEFNLPEGVQFADGEVDAFKTVAKDLKLPKEGAQRILDIATAREQARAEAFQTTVRGWAETTKADKELGKDENIAIAKKTVETFGTPELKEVLNSSGLGNHPEMIRLMARIGNAMTEDSVVKGDTGEGTAKPTLANRLYPTSNQQPSA